MEDLLETNQLYFFNNSVLLECKSIKQYIFLISKSSVKTKYKIIYHRSLPQTFTSDINMILKIKYYGY